MEQVGTGAKTVYDYSPLASLHDVYTGITQNKGATLAAGIGGLIPGAGPEVRAAERAAERGAVSAAEREAERIAIANQNPVTGTLPESATRPTARNPANWSPSVLDDLDAQYREIPKSQTRVYTGADPTLPAEPTSTQKSAAAAATVQQRRELMPDQWLDTSRAPLLTDSRISQRVPTGANTFDIDPLRQDLRIDIDTMLKDPDYAHAAANAARGLVPDKLARSQNPETILYGARDQFMKNLDAIYSRLDPNIRDRATLWYPGGNTLAATMAARHGISTEAAAGTIAALSPQKDWYQNVEMADRIMKTAADNPTVTRELVDSLRNRKLQSGEPSGFAQYADELERHIGSTFKDLPDREAGILAVAHDAMERTPRISCARTGGLQDRGRARQGRQGWLAGQAEGPRLATDRLPGERRQGDALGRRHAPDFGGHGREAQGAELLQQPDRARPQVQRLHERHAQHRGVAAHAHRLVRSARRCRPRHLRAVVGANRRIRPLRRLRRCRPRAGEEIRRRALRGAVADLGGHALDVLRRRQEGRSARDREGLASLPQGRHQPGARPGDGLRQGAEPEPRPLEERLMSEGPVQLAALLTPAQADYIGLPPRPLIPQQDIVNSDGTPTFEFNLFLTMHYEWERRLLSVLTGQLYPASRPIP